VGYFCTGPHPASVPLDPKGYSQLAQR